MDIADITNQDSLDNFEEIIPTLKRGGTVAFDVNFVPSDATQNGTTGLLSFMYGRTKKTWQILVGPTLSVQFDGYVVKWGPKFPVANVATATIDIRVTGKVTIATAL